MRKLSACLLIACGLLIPASYSQAASAPKTACFKHDKFKERVEADKLIPVTMGTLKDGTMVMFLVSRAGDNLDSPEDKSIVVKVSPKEVCILGEIEGMVVAPQGGGGGGGQGPSI